ncbi:MAG: Hsp20 family protein [Bacteroidia bacterium]
MESLNIKETTEGYELEVPAPGLNKDNFKVELDEGMLVISEQNEIIKEDKNQNGNYTRKEYSYESFQGSFSLRENMIDTGKISARYLNGVLHVTVPKIVSGMNRYKVIKRLKKLLNKLGAYLQGNMLAGKEVEPTLHELDSYIRDLKANVKNRIIPLALTEKIALFSEAFKHYTGIETSNNPEIKGMNDLQGFMAGLLGISILRKPLLNK